MTTPATAEQSHTSSTAPARQLPLRSIDPSRVSPSTAVEPSERTTSTAWEESSLPVCTAGQQLFDARHGVVVVEGIETRMLQGRPAAYVTVRTVERDLRLLVPLESAPVGLRRLINAEEADAVLAELGAEAQPTPVWTTQSFAELQRKAFGRSPLVVAGIVRDLTAKATGARLRSNEQILLTKATDLVAAELAAALRLTRSETVMRMAAALERGQRLAEQKADQAPEPIAWGSEASPDSTDSADSLAQASERASRA